MPLVRLGNWLSRDRVETNKFKLWQMIEQLTGVHLLRQASVFRGNAVTAV